MKTGPTTEESEVAKRRGTARSIIDNLASITAFLSATCVALVMAVILFDVTRRQLTGQSFPGAMEYAEILMVAIVFFSLGFAQMTHSHVVIDIVVEKLPPRVAAILDTVVLAVVGVILLWVSFETAQAALSSYERGEQRFGLAKVPMWPARAVLPVGFASMALQCLLQAWDGLTSVLHDHRTRSASADAPTSHAPQED